MAARIDFSKLRFGKEAAEEEKAHLLEYFVETKAFQQIQAGEGWIVLGSKGSGKTALATKLLASGNSEIGYINVSPSTVDWEMLRSAEGVITRQARKTAWMLSFLFAAMSQAKAGCQRGIPEAAIQEQLSRVGIVPEHGGTGWKISEIGLEKGLPMFKAAKHQREAPSRETVMATSHAVEKAVQVAFGMLEEVLRADGYSIRLVIDRFDEHWKGDAADVDTAIALVTAAREASELAPSIRALVFIRTDIWSKLGWATVDHLNSQIVRLSWSSEDLAQLIRRRIEWSLDLKADSAEQALRMVFYGFVSVRAHTTGSGGTILPWHFISTVIPRRPRDAILFAETARKARPSTSRWISGEELLAAEPLYSKLRRRNVEKAEGAHLEGKLKMLNDCLRDLPARFAAKHLLAVLERKESGRARELLALLMEYEICGLVKEGAKQGRAEFLEDDDDLLETDVKDAMLVVIHPSLRHALGVADRFSDFEIMSPAHWEHRPWVGERRR